MADQKQREVRMSARKRPGNAPRAQRRAHGQVRAMWRRAQVGYAAGTDAAFIRMDPGERWHESRKVEEADGG